MMCAPEGRPSVLSDVRTRVWTQATKEASVSDLIAIGYDDETTATAAAEEVRRLAQDLIIQPDAVAVIVCDKEG